MRFAAVILALACASPAFASLRALEKPGAIVIKMTAPEARLAPVLIDGQDYLRLEAEGLANRLPPGAPAVPTEEAVLAIPAGTHPVVEVIRAEREDVPLVHELAFLDHPDCHCGPAKRVARDEKAYARDYGADPVVVEEVGYAASDRLAYVRFWPFHYDAARGTLTRVRRLTARFHFVADRAAAPPVVRFAEPGSVAHYVALNPPAARAALFAPRTDLVIAHTSYQFALSRYLDYKRSKGREVREYYVDGKSAEEIKELIVKEYGSAKPPTSTLLVGNIDQIPSWSGSGDNRWTDYPYTTLDRDRVPDLALGRIPAHSVEEFLGFVDKLIARETDRTNVDEILITAGRDTSLGCPANVAKVGANIKEAGDKVNIIRRFKTEVDTDAVIEGYNGNPNVIVYDGHGNRQGMQEIPLTISSLDRLTNRQFPLILDIACLNANWTSSGAEPRNFAESILLLPSSGAAGIMASGGSGNGHQFFQTIGSLMAEGRHNLASDPSMNEIGRIIMAAKAKNGNQDRTYWNYYGDPASSVWESTL